MRMKDNNSVPAGWKWVECQEVIDVRDGTHDTPKYVSIGFPLITSKNLSISGINLDEVQFISEEDHRNISKRSRVDKGDILYAMIGTIGNPVIVETETDFSIKNIALFKFHQGLVYNKFFKHLLDADIIKRQILSNVRGGIQKFASLKVLRGLKIPLPPLTEQKRIAAILDKADTIRQKRRQAIQLADEFLRSVFLDMFGDSVLNHRGWKTVSVGEKLSFLTSGSRGWAKYYSNEGRLFLRIQNIGANQLFLDDVAYVNPPDSAEAKRTMVRAGDVLLSITADLGRTAVIPSDFPPAHINQHLAILRFDDIEPIFASAFFASKGGQNQIQKLNREGVKAGLNFDDIRSLEIILPPKDLQKKWSDIYHKNLTQKSLLRHSLRTQTELFNSLTQRAFRGKL